VPVPPKLYYSRGVGYRLLDTSDLVAKNLPYTLHTMLESNNKPSCSVLILVLDCWLLNLFEAEEPMFYIVMLLYISSPSMLVAMRWVQMTRLPGQ
jgi:hypothetical protein